MLITLLRPRSIQRAVMKIETYGSKINKGFLQSLTPVSQPIETIIFTSVGNGPQQV